MYILIVAFSHNDFLYNSGNVRSAILRHFIPRLIHLRFKMISVCLIFLLLIAACERHLKFRLHVRQKSISVLVCYTTYDSHKRINYLMKEAERAC